jgi:hypothetical protein
MDRFLHQQRTRIAPTTAARKKTSPIPEAKLAHWRVTMENPELDWWMSLFSW